MEAVRKRKSPPLGKRPWTPEDESYLTEKWGYASVPAIAKKLNRTENAVVVRAQRLGLGAVLMAGGYVTLNQLLATVTGRERGNTYQRKSWVENRGLPVHRKKVNRCSFSVVYLEEFWKWAEHNRSFLDFSKMEPLALGWEPAWVAEQRKKDYRACAIQRKDPWTADEDSRLKMLLSQHKYTWAELSEMLHRTTGAIQHRCRDLGIKDRPVKADNHGKSAVWNERDYAVLADGIRHGDSYMAIGQALGKSEKAVRGKVYTVYLTENADKVREHMGDGPWGAGAPEPKVKQAVHLSTTRTEVRKLLSYLAGLLQKRRMIWATIRIGSGLCVSTGTTSAAALLAARIVMTAQNFGVSVRSIALGAAARSTRGKRTVSAVPAGRQERRKHSGIGTASIIAEQERRTTNGKM